MSEVADPLERVSEEAIRDVIRQCSNHPVALGELSHEPQRRICEEVLGYRAARKTTDGRGMGRSGVANVDDPLHDAALIPDGRPRGTQCQEPDGGVERLRTEDRLHRAFLTLILEYHDYTYDEVSPEVVLRGIEQQAKALDAQLGVSVHTLDMSERVGPANSTGNTECG